MAEIDDVYFPDRKPGDDGPAFVRRWELIDGRPQCPLGAIPAADAAATPALQKNRAIRVLVGPVEAYEAALAIVARGEPDNGQPRQIPDPAAVRTEDAPDDWTPPLIANPEWALLPRTVETVGQDGEPQTAPEPRWQAYDAAQAIIAASSSTTLALARWRQGEPSQDDVDAHAAWATAKAAALAALASEATKPLAHDPRPIPPEVPLWALQAALKIRGHFDQVDAFALAQKETSPVVYFAWTMGNVVSWASALVAQFEPQFGIDETERAVVFRLAAAISASA